MYPKKCYSENTGPTLIQLVLLLPGLTITLLALVADYLGIGSPGSGFGRGETVVLAAGLALIILGLLASRLTSQLQLGLVLYGGTIFIAMFFGYLTVEAAATMHTWYYPDQTFWLFENSGNTVHFDPIRGYRLTSIPSRVTRIFKGQVEYLGVLRGNSQGFPDRDNFGPERDPSFTKRFAVFGDSFTAGQYLEQNWPDRAEDILRQNQNPTQLQNFSLDGGGLANWWSVLTKLVTPENYDLDGVIFAVFEGNLMRKFTVAEHRGYKRHMFARMPSWDPKLHPNTSEEAREFLRETAGYILSSQEFDRALSGDVPSSVSSDFSLVILPHILNLFETFKTTLIPPSPRPKMVSNDEFDAGRMALIEDIHRYLRKYSLPALVVHIRSKENVIRGSPTTSAFFHQTREFANGIEATFIDGGEAFANMDSAEVRDHFFFHDAHWNQKGSDRFAEFIVQNLQHQSP